MSTEGPFWSSTIDLAGPHAATAGGIMNTAGNAGGVVSTALAVIAAVVWLFIRLDQTADE